MASLANIAASQTGALTGRSYRVPLATVVKSRAASAISAGGSISDSELDNATSADTASTVDSSDRIESMSLSEAATQYDQVEPKAASTQQKNVFGPTRSGESSLSDAASARLGDKTPGQSMAEKYGNDVAGRFAMGSIFAPIQGFTATFGVGLRAGIQEILGKSLTNAVLGLFGLGNESVSDNVGITGAAGDYEASPGAENVGVSGVVSGGYEASPGNYGVTGVEGDYEASPGEKAETGNWGVEGTYGNISGTDAGGGGGGGGK